LRGVLVVSELYLDEKEKIDSRLRGNDIWRSGNDIWRSGNDRGFKTNNILINLLFEK
jgi:hypothetical protein